MNTTEKILLVLVVISNVFFAVAFGYELGKRNVRQEALLNGHAAYIYDSEGVPHFKWSECIQF
jgi:hypothetical protein